MAVSESTLKRHGYYCRSRRAGGTTRSRSCIACAKGKARCDNKQPECSRCATKAIECHYRANTPGSAGSRIRHGEDVSTGPRTMASALVTVHPHGETLPATGNDGDILLDRAQVISTPDFATLGGEYLDWDDPEIEIAGFMAPQVNNKTIDYPPFDPSSLFRSAPPSIGQTLQVQQATSTSSPIVSIPPFPSHIVRSLTQRPKPRAGAQRIANLMLHILKSYPKMLIRDTLPPFIHPHLISSDVGEKNMEPLTNCISLVHMISTGVQGCRKLFWKNVRLECERLCEEVR